METNAVIAAGALAAAVPLPAAAAAQSNGIGYYVLTSNGGVHNYGTPWYGSDAGKLPIGMTATGFAADPATGGYWIMKSDGNVDSFHAPWFGSAPMRGQAVTGFTGTPGGGYLMLTSDGGVDAFNAPWYGSLAWPVPTGQSVTGITGE